MRFPLIPFALLTYITGTSTFSTIMLDAQGNHTLRTSYDRYYEGRKLFGSVLSNVCTHHRPSIAIAHLYPRSETLADLFGLVSPFLPLNPPYPTT